MIGQFSGPYSPARSTKIQSFLLANCCVIYHQIFSTYEQITVSVLKLSFILNCVLKRINDLKTISNWLVLLSTWFRNLKPFFMNKNRCRTRQTHNRDIIKVGTHGGTSPCDWSLRLVASCELAIFASKSSRRDQLWSLRLVPRIQTSLNFWDKSLRLVLQNASCELFVGQVPATSPFV